MKGKERFKRWKDFGRCPRSEPIKSGKFPENGAISGPGSLSLSLSRALEKSGRLRRPSPTWTPLKFRLLSSARFIASWTILRFNVMLLQKRSTFAGKFLSVSRRAPGDPAGKKRKITRTTMPETDAVMFKDVYSSSPRAKHRISWKVRYNSRICSLTRLSN